MVGGRPVPPAAAAPWPSWFEHTQPALLGNRVLREVLLPHPAEAWPELVKQLALLGALCARAELGAGRTLTAGDLKALSTRVHSQLALGAALPGIAAQVEALEGEFSGFLRELDVNENRQVRTRAPTSAAASQRDSASAGSSQPKGSRAAPARSIYPDWWPADGSSGGNNRGRGPSGTSQQKQRPPPRLAYAKPQPPAAPPVHQDDIVTPEWLMVQAKVAGKATAGRAPPAGAPCGQAGPDGRAPAVESRVRLLHEQRLVLDAQARGAQHNAAGSAAAPGGLSGLRQRERTGAGSRSGGKGAATHGPAQPAGAGLDQQALAKWRQHFGLP